MTSGRITLDRTEHLGLLRRCGDAEERAALAEQRVRTAATALLDLAAEADAKVTELEAQLAAERQRAHDFVDACARLGALCGEREGESSGEAVERVVHERDERDSMIESVRAELRATGHGDVAEHARLNVAVSQAIDKERHRIESALEGWLHAETTVAAIARLRAALTDREAVLEKIERALGAHCTGDLSADVERLASTTLAPIPVAVVERIERVGDEEDGDVG